MPTLALQSKCASWRSDCRTDPRRRQARQPAGRRRGRASTNASRRWISRAPAAPRESASRTASKFRVDGNPAALVDLSAVGAQVRVATVLKPNQRVRIAMGDGKAAVKCAGVMAWAAFEMPKGLPTRYRAGIDLGATSEGHGVETLREETQERRKLAFVISASPQPRRRH